MLTFVARAAVKLVGADPATTQHRLPPPPGMELEEEPSPVLEVRADLDGGRAAGCGRNSVRSRVRLRCA